MEQLLTGFVRALRATGADTSTAETIDAAQVLSLVGWQSRSDLKTALAQVLAKSAEEKQIHDRVFDLYFSLPMNGAALASDSAMASGADDPTALWRTGDAAVDAALDLAAPGQGENLVQALGRAASQVAVDDIRFATQVPYFTRRLLEALGLQPLDQRLSRLLAATSTAQDAAASARSEAEIQALRAARDRLQQQARALVQQRFELYGRPATEAFMTDVAVHRALGRLAPADMARMKVAVARMARKLAARHAQRQRKQQRGQLDFRRTLRANAGHDGVPVSLAWRQRRRDKPRIVAICDVSGSVAAQVRFLLLFLHALQDAVADLRSFAFSSHLQEVSAALDALPFDEAMAQILQQLGMGSTDYGQAWLDMQQQHEDCIDRRTTVIVLGDGRSNGSAPRLALFAAMAERAKRVIWLCPEAPGRWGSGDSDMLVYRPHCSRLSHCATATDLERCLDEVLEAYH